MAERQSQRDRIKEITDGIEQGIKDLFNSDNFRQYLKTMSRFHHYSLNNIILIQQNVHMPPTWLVLPSGRTNLAVMSERARKESEFWLRLR